MVKRQVQEKALTSISKVSFPQYRYIGDFCGTTSKSHFSFCYFCIHFCATFFVFNIPEFFWCSSFHAIHLNSFSIRNTQILEEKKVILLKILSWINVNTTQSVWTVKSFERKKTIFFSEFATIGSSAFCRHKHECLSLTYIINVL